MQLSDVRCTLTDGQPALALYSHSTRQSDLDVNEKQTKQHK